MNNEIKEIPQIDATLEYSLEDFMESYKMVDVEQIYSNGTKFVPIFRVKQWLEYNNINNLQSKIDKANNYINDERKKIQKHQYSTGIRRLNKIQEILKEVSK